MGYWVGVLVITGINMIAALGLSLLLGFTGVFSIGHAGFMAVGGYVSALLSQKGLPIPLSIAGGVLSAMLFSLVLGTPTLRLAGDYFVIASLAFGEVIILLIQNLPFTGGARGLTGVPIATNLSIVLVLSLLSIVGVRNFIKSRYGRACKAVREEELAAECLGVATFRVKVLSFVISAAYCGLAGALMGHYIGYLHPIMFSGAKSTDLMLPVLVGGQGSLSGTIVASLILFPLLEVLRATMELRLIVYGFVLVLTMLFRPQGLLGRREIQLNFRRWTARTKGMEE